MKRIFVVLFSFMFLMSCGLISDYKGINEKVTTPITFRNADYPLRFIKSDNLEEGRMVFYKSYIVIVLESEFYFNVIDKTLSIKEENNLTKIKVLNDSNLETVLMELEERLQVEFILLDYKVNEIVNEMLSKNYRELTYKETSITKNPLSSSIEIKKLENTSFALFKDSLEELMPYITFDKTKPISIMLMSRSKTESSVYSISIKKEVGYEKVYDGSQTAEWNEKAKTIRNYIDLL